jgi:hypothetical protein
MKRLTDVFMAIAIAALVAGPASAQTDVAPRMAVAFAGGIGSTVSTTGVALGGTALYDLNDRLSVEAQGTYLDRGRAAEAFSATGSLLVNLVPRDRRIVPYAAAGGGVHRAEFDLGDPRFLGPVGPEFAPGTAVCPAPGSGIGFGPGGGFGAGDGSCNGTAVGYWGVGQMSNFYARRLGMLTVPAGTGWERRSFVDPAATLGGGIRFNVSEHLMIRPDVRALLVFGDGDTHAMTVFVFNVGYRF